MSMVDSSEKIPALYPDQKKGSIAVAMEIARLIRSKQENGKNVFWSSTGSTPKSLYAELVRTPGRRIKF